MFPKHKKCLWLWAIGNVQVIIYGIMGLLKDIFSFLGYRQDEYCQNSNIPSLPNPIFQYSIILTFQTV